MTADDPLELLVTYLRQHSDVSDLDAAALRRLPFQLRAYNPATYLAREGEMPDTCGVLVSGFAFRQKLSGDGGRQIVSVHIPGEPVDFQTLYLRHADHNIQALTRLELAQIPRDALQALLREREGLAAAMNACTAVEASIMREWVLNIGRRNGRARLAHLLCEFATRLTAQGLAEDGRYALPMTQEQLGDALGLTAVHINRTIRQLEREGVVTREGRELTFPSIDQLGEIGDFNPLYLHRESYSRH